MKITPGFTILLIIWAFIFFNIGFNIFGFFVAAIPTVIYMTVVGGIQDAKATMYLANKYDEEKNKDK